MVSRAVSAGWSVLLRPSGGASSWCSRTLSLLSTLTGQRMRLAGFDTAANLVPRHLRSGIRIVTGVVTSRMNRRPEGG